MTFRQVWEHQLRWARTIRVCEPLPFFFSVLANTLILGAGWLLISLFVGRVWAILFALAGVFAYAIVRFFTASFHFEKLTRSPAPRWKLLQLIDHKDALTFVWWLAAFLGNTIVWRGHRHRILKEGRLAPMAQEKPD